ncbi:helix-turn-helix transcriptional regulator [Pantoea sp. A4]|uniref:helix-turn-helix transcriptional regulator n=1 Tax=Pantoea sp. A4 TaxID=1225184 RepID=UPI00037C3753|nr:PAS domain-containing protein [Pantoea sp. A4]
MTEQADELSFEQEILQILAAAVRAIGSVLPGNTELVLHDLRNPAFSVVEIANAHVTGRKKGDSVLAGLRKDKAFITALEESQERVTLLPDYETFSREGTPLRSGTAIYRGRDSRPFAALCVNVDNNGIENALTLLHTLSGVKIPDAEVRIADQPHDTIEDLMKEIISNATGLNPGSRRADAKKAKMLAVQQMQERGIFLMKGGVEKAAEALGVTRYTIYNYLDELKNTDS